MDKILTIGIYGFDKDSFFKTLLNAKIEVFCDIRRRRGLRGSQYAFANSQNLQQSLREIGIRYTYIKELAPGQEMRERQKQEDKSLGIAKRNRTSLGKTFIHEYEEECLSRLNPLNILDEIGLDARVISLFCVERDPEACHRSLASSWLAAPLNLSIDHLMPPVV